MDPQTNGFGAFELIPAGAEGDSTLARWKQIFVEAIRNDWQAADSLLQLHGTNWDFELVHFTDTELQKEFYIFRELLDFNYIDFNGDGPSENDVVGSFNKGWGVFVFNPTARHPEAVIQMPHPEDDFLSIPVGLEMFIRNEAAIMMIAGAGREVLWDEEQNEYTNTYSLSDPTRNGRHPFAKCTEAAFDEWNSWPVSPLVVLQLHSYDHYAHIYLSDIQACAYRDDGKPNPPLRDVGFHEDIVHGMQQYPVNGIDGDTAIIREIDSYFGLWSSPVYSFYNADPPIALVANGDLLGSPNNIQAVYCHQGHNVDRHTENFIHVELDEYPDGLWTPVNWTRWLPGTPPATPETFQHALTYYMPFIVAWDSALTWHALPDTSAPLYCAPYQATETGGNKVYVRWGPYAADPHFDTYEVFYDLLPITPNSPKKTRTSTGYSALGTQTTTGIEITGLNPPLENYRFAVRAKDMLGYTSALSTEIGITDGLIHDLTFCMVNDSLHLNWSSQPSDSVYRVSLLWPDSVNYTLFQTVPDTFHYFTVPDTIVNGAILYQVERVLHQ
ncbi:hypothetical protein IT157_10055 [bacterium]|nr:hypothetical protein [bacterium]